jgi:hypothetical protein
LRAENLKEIGLVGNDIGAEGLLTIVKADWENISNTNLCNNFMIKASIKTETKDTII